MFECKYLRQKQQRKINKNQITKNKMKTNQQTRKQKYGKTRKPNSTRNEFFFFCKMQNVYNDRSNLNLMLKLQKTQKQIKQIKIDQTRTKTSSDTK